MVSKKILIGIGVAVALCLAVAITLAVVLTQKPVCNTDVCKKTATLLKASMDEDVDPCDDFYKFACGKFVKNNPLLQGEQVKGHFHNAIAKLDQNLLNMMQKEPVKGNSGSAVDNAITLMNKCIHSAKNERSKNMELLYSILRDHMGGCPLLPDSMSSTTKFNWSRSLANIIRNIDQNFIFSVTTVPPLNATSLPIIALTPGVFRVLGGLESIMRAPPERQPIRGYSSLNDDIRQIICKIDIYCYRNVYLDDDIYKIVAAYGSLYQYSAAPGNGSLPAASPGFNVLKAYPQIEMKEETITIGSLKGRIPGVAWLEFFNIVFKGTDITVTENTFVTTYIELMKYLINELLVKFPERTVQNWLGLRIIEKWGPLLLNEVRDLLTYATVEEKCLEFTTDTLGYAVGNLYDSMYVSNETYSQTMRLVLDLKGAFKELVTENSWMDEATKKNAFIKIDNMVESVSTPDWARNRTTLDEYYKKIGNLNQLRFQDAFKTVLKFGFEKQVDLIKAPIDRRNYWPVPTSAVTNAFYYQNANAMMFPSGILALPFFEHGRPSAMNYGAFGYVAGHEITHGFDDTGRARDELGRRKDWWTPESLRKFEDKARCFVNQYNHILERSSGLYLNGELTLGENIADNGGIREAFRAYKNYQKTSGEKDERLPGLTKYNQDQLFFISAGYMYCTVSSSRFLNDQIVTDPHSPNQYRVTVPFQNSKDFSDAFSCSKKDKMNPQSKCVIW